MNKKLYKLMNWPLIEGVTYTEEDKPFAVLGCKSQGAGSLLQAFFPDALSVNALIPQGKTVKSYPMELADDMGYFAYLHPTKLTSRYEYEVKYQDRTVTVKDAYAFTGFEIKEKDILKIKSGIHYSLYDCLGAHVCTNSGISGVRFAIWAPNAIRVSVALAKMNFDGRIYQMQKNDETGIFELFIPDVAEGDEYLYEIKMRGGNVVRKTDPFSAKIKCGTDFNRSVVCESKYQFEDESYMENKGASLKDGCISICEIDLSSIGRKDDGTYLSYEELSAKVIKYVGEMGYTHVKLMPVSFCNEKSSDDYRTIGYYSVNNRFGDIDGFKKFVNDLHTANIGVILDFRCAYFDNDAMGLGRFDGTALYEHLDDKKGINPINGAYVFNYGRPEVSNYLIANALFWVEMCHVDGLCVDALSSMLYLDYRRGDGEWIANIYGGNENLEAIEFVKHLNSILHKRNPDVITIANEDSAFPKVTGQLDDEGLGFDYKFNNGFADDFEKYIACDPYFRAHHHNELTFSMIYQYSENFISGFSHDYVSSGKGSLISKMPGDDKGKYANLRLAYSYIMTHPGAKIFTLGQDFASDTEFDSLNDVNWSLCNKEKNKGIKTLVKDLNKIYKNNKALYEYDKSNDGFEWINCISPDRCLISYYRKGSDVKDILLVVCNFSGVDIKTNVGTSYPGKYKMVFSSEDKEYGGKGNTDNKVKTVSETEADSRPYSIEVKLPALSVEIYKYTPFTEKEKLKIAKKKEAAIAKTKALQYREEALDAQKDYDEAKAIMEEACEKMKEAKARKDKALANEQKEIQKANLALEETK